ncbi:uncharacterized protein DUF4625 [Chitinophaga skermanii]|uniref:Uncharacterized protein DUF4625 n=1 Tax=Chitinophaga skermanii TaxID=331697 RepID=A0A327QLI7_9BACT|nr:DUF4625 domain-containing protein [Chitinophaga skermanii]RAJ05409.1 uncharacterized protein DUF4625 [Chitinophaga skermanii]
MKFNIGKIVMAIGMSVFLFACSKDDDPVPSKPTLNVTEIGHSNSKIAYVGADLHLDAEIEAANNIASIQVRIFQASSNTGWKYDSTYTQGFAGTKNADFHKHIDIPATAAVGKYHIQLVVKDQKGQQTTFDGELDIQANVDLPNVTGIHVSLNDAKDDLHVDAQVAAPKKIASITVTVKGAWTKATEYKDEAMVGQTSYKLHKHIHVGEAPAGHYHVFIKVVDQAGKSMEFEEHFDK